MKRFLLVDDDAIFNFLHTEVIKTVDSSAQIDLFNSSTEGLEFLKEALEGHREMPHFLFLDIRMPEMDGFEYLDELMHYPLEKFKDIRIYVQDLEVLFYFDFVLFHFILIFKSFFVLIFTIKRYASFVWRCPCRAGKQHRKFGDVAKHSGRQR